MKVIVSPDGESTGKFASMVQAFPNIWSGSVLDVGCRSRQLKDALPKETVSCARKFNITAMKVSFAN